MQGGGRRRVLWCKMVGPAETEVGPIALSSPERLAPGGPEWIRWSWTTLWKDRQNGPDKVYLPRTLRGWVREQGRLLGEPLGWVLH